jgi:hypothetical protein
MGIFGAILAVLTLVVGILQLWKMHRNHGAQPLIYELVGTNVEVSTMLQWKRWV